jgi:hypothetical protein
MKIGDKAKDVISAVAPTLGTALGGPLGGLAGALVAQLVGGGDPKKAEEAIVAQSPAALADLKKAELEYLKRLEELELDHEKVAQLDRASAREREVKTGDQTPALLAVGVTGGFFGVLGYMLMYGTPENGGDALLVMLGSLGTAWAAVVSYYFGSSAGSKLKTELMSKGGGNGKGR